MNLGQYTWWNNPYPPDPGDNDPYGFIPQCVHCDDAGCDRCCPTEPVTMQDLEHIEEEMAEERSREERLQLENEAMAEHFRRYPNG